MWILRGNFETYWEHWSFYGVDWYCKYSKGTYDVCCSAVSRPVDKQNLRKTYYLLLRQLEMFLKENLQVQSLPGHRPSPPKTILDRPAGQKSWCFGTKIMMSASTPPWSLYSLACWPYSRRWHTGLVRHWGRFRLEHGSCTAQWTWKVWSSLIMRTIIILIFSNPPAIAVLEEGVDLSGWDIVAAGCLLLIATRMPVAWTLWNENFLHNLIKHGWSES